MNHRIITYDDTIPVSEKKIVLPLSKIPVELLEEMALDLKKKGFFDRMHGKGVKTCKKSG